MCRYSAWHFNVGADWYFQWLCAIMVHWAILGKIFHLLAKEDENDKDRNERTTEIAVSLVLFTYWYACCCVDM